jgi:predicted dehydrogenase
MNKLRVAVVGVGSIGQHHARIASASGRAELVAVVDPDEVRGRATAERWGACWSPSLAGVLPRVDAVQIAAPTCHHLAIGLEALRAGRHVLMEKPLAATLGEGERLLEELARACAVHPGLVAAAGHLERFNPAVRALRAIGLRPRFAEARRISPFPMRSLEVDVIMDLMIHDLDLLLALVGRPVAGVEAFGAPVLTPFIDMAQAHLRFEGGAFATVTASRVARKKERTLRVFGGTTCAHLDLVARTLETERLEAGATGPRMVSEAVPCGGEEPLMLELEAFYAACANEPGDTVSWQEALEALRVADALQKSVARNLAGLETWSTGAGPGPSSH